MRILKTLAVIVLMTTLSAVSGNARDYSLEECIRIGLEKSPAIRAAGYDIESAVQDINVARTEFYPKISSAASASGIRSIEAIGPTQEDYLDQDITKYSVTLSQTLFAGMALINTYYKARDNKALMEANKKYKELDLIYRIETAFFLLMKAKRDAAAIQGTVHRLKTSLESVNAYFENALVPYVDVLQTRVDLADAEHELSMAKNLVEKQRSELMFLTNMDADDAVSFTGELDYYENNIHTSFDENWEFARTNRPDLKTYEKQIDMVMRDIKIARSARYPKVTLQGGYYHAKNNYDSLGYTVSAGYYDRDQENTYWSAGVYATWQLFDGFKSSFQKKKYLAQIKGIQEKMIEAENVIKKGIRESTFSLSEARQRISLAQEAFGVAEEGYQGKVKMFESRLTTLPDLLNAQDRLTRAEKNQDQALLDYQLERARLNFIIGNHLKK